MAAGGWKTAVLGALLIGVGSPPFALAQSSTAPSQVPGSVLVHIESAEPVDLELETGDRRDPLYVACRSPCDKWVPASGMYRIAGGGTRASRRFILLANAGRETVVVSPARSTEFVIGIAAIVVGAVATSIGAFGLLANLFAGPDASGNGLLVGAIAGGLAVEAGGIALVSLNASSRVHQTTALGPSARSSSALLPPEVAHRGAPIPGYPRAASWPLLRVTF
jgi:hypothetical protein